MYFMTHLPIGKTEIKNTLFAIEEPTRRRHMAIFGKSGVGKTTLLRNMATWDIHNGQGVTVIDPHGGLIDDLLEIIPRSRTNDIIYFDPREHGWALGLNILESVSNKYQPLVVSSLISIFKKLWGESWGPRLEDILRNSAYALFEQKQPVSLVAIPKLLTNTEYRKQILKQVSNPAVRNFFDVYEGWNERFREEAISPVLNKVNAFITNPLLRSIIGQAKSSFDFRWMMDNKKILLCNFSKGALGEDVSSLLGSLVVTKISLAALSRENIEEEKRQSHFLYADEIQNFVYGMDFPTILSEARKYRLALIVATQTLNQLPEKIISAVFGNCATVMSFRISGEDAEVLQREFADVMLPASLLQDLPDYKVYVRTMSKGLPKGPYPVDVFPPIVANNKAANKQNIINNSLRRHGRRRSEVETKIDHFLAA